MKLEKIPEFIKKENTYTFFSDLCLRCAMNFECVASSRVALKKNDYILSIRHLTPQTQAMLEGREIHEQFAKAIPTIEELTYQKYVHELKSGNEVILKEVAVCSMVRGLRGVIDVLKVRREVNELGVEYFITIQENKSRGFNKLWYYQLATYGIILMSPQCFIHFDDGSFEPFYIDEQVIKNINAYVCVIENLSFFPSIPFMVKNKLSEWWLPFVVNVYKKAKEKRRYHRRGLYLLDLPEEKERQTFFGKTKLLRKTPPPLSPKLE